MFCRASRFAPSLEVNDVVIYFAANHNWDTGFPHYRLVAILEVIKKTTCQEAVIEEVHALALQKPNSSGSETGGTLGQAISRMIETLAFVPDYQAYFSRVAQATNHCGT
jgi:hypothetical protein